MLQVVPISKPRIGLIEGSPSEAERNALIRGMHREPAPQGHGRPQSTPCSETVFDQDGHLQGSYAAVAFWGWFQITYLHAENGPRLNEVYRHLTARLKTAALQHGCHAVLVHCFTAEDEARLACEGFHRVGKLDDYPRGFAHRVMVCRLPRKRWTMSAGASPFVHRVGTAIDPNQLNRYLAARGLAPLTETPVNRVIRNRAGRLVAGVLAEINWQQLSLNGLWTDPEFRGRGCASRLLHAMENEARRRQLDHILLDTFSFQALFFYQRHGYRVYATLRDFPTGHERHYLAKRL